MTLLSLLIVMALERVTLKSKQFHIATLATRYFTLLKQKGILQSTHSGSSGDSSSGDQNAHSKIDLPKCLLITAGPAITLYFVLDWLPILLVFALNLVVLWVCLGCPVTRQTYKRYLQAAHREDFQACSLHSMSFGNEGGDLNNVGKQLVLVNYRQYAAVIIFFIVLGAPGVLFYSLVKEWVMQERSLIKSAGDNSDENGNDTQAEVLPPAESDEASAANESSAGESLLAIIDWLPARITAFGFLVVGHFSNALSAWFDIIVHPNTSAYDALAKVSKAAEDVSDADAVLNEPLQLVRLVKRNIVFMLMSVSLLTMVGYVA